MGTLDPHTDLFTIVLVACLEWAAEIEDPERLRDLTREVAVSWSQVREDERTRTRLATLIIELVYREEWLPRLRTRKSWRYDERIRTIVDRVMPEVAKLYQQGKL